MKQNTDFNYNFLLTGASTSVGLVRKANEDSMAIFEVDGMKVFVVCDGMGGHVGGKVASETAITAIRDFLFNNVTVDPREAINNSIVAANDAILCKAAQQPELSGMGSTCVMLAVTGDGRVYYGHVGDSRIYIVASHRIAQLTKDHSFVQTLVDARQITKEQAERHPRRNEITNALGLPSMQPPTVCSTPIEPESGNCFLLCSDGLTGMVGDDQIQRVISKHEIPIQQRAEKLVEMANANGGVDNITVELAEFALGTQQISGGKKPKRSKKLMLYVLTALAAFGCLAWYFITSKKDIPANETIYNIRFILKDSVKYKSNEWINLGVKVKTAEADSAFRQFLTVKGIDKDYTSVSFEWTEKEFTQNSIMLLCNADSVIYHITVPVKYPAKATAVPEQYSFNAKSIKPVEITSDTVHLELNTEKSITFTDFKEKEAKSIRLKTGGQITVSSEPSTVQIIGKIESKNKVSIIWTEGEIPPRKAVFKGEGENGTVYVITLYLKKSDVKQKEKQREEQKEEQKEKYVNLPTTPA